MNVNDIYKEIAKRRNITKEEVKQEIQQCIQQAYQNPNKTFRMKQMQNKVPKDGEIPTTDEFMEFILIEMMKQME